MPVTRSSWFLSPEIKNHGGFLERDASISPPQRQSSSAARISPAVLFIIVILAVVFFISGLLHLLVRFLLRRYHADVSNDRSRAGDAAEDGGADALQRQLQQLFHLHDAGLDQAFIDALPVFLYREVVGAKEPFDCAVCLCEFAGDDKLRLLPLCGHAFHIDCIDTWLLSNSTCPLCRGALFVPGLSVDNPMFEFEEVSEEEQKPDRGEEAAAMANTVFPVRLGKFKNLGRREGAVLDGDDAVLDRDGDVGDAGIVRREEGETSSSSLDARRCYSMGSYQYVLGDASLQVSVHRRHGDGNGRCVRVRGIGANLAGSEGFEGKKICAGSKGDSFSVSKIWQWRDNKGKLPVLASDGSSVDGGLPWARRSVGDT